jgi:Ca2+-binding RTX toxin-like protein
LIKLNGFTRNSSFIDGGDGYDVLHLSSANDAFFLSDEYSDKFQSVPHDFSGWERVRGVEEIHAGAGDDLIDMTRVQSRTSSVGVGYSLFGDDGNDTIWGFETNDFLDGGRGDDVLFGGAGIDYLHGGDGADTFVFTKTSVQSTILDFDPSEGDSLQFVSSPGCKFDLNTIEVVDDSVSIQYSDFMGNLHYFLVSIASEDF